MEKLDMKSMNRIEENIRKLATIFPECVTEAKQSNGGGYLKQAVDFDAFKSLFSDVIIEGNTERYQFTWPDKQKAKANVNRQITSTLRPCKEESVNFDTTENLYIEGDNLEVLKLLQETYLGKIKLIYIDPPYNTGHDFVYKDTHTQSNEHYLSNSGQMDDLGNRLVENVESNGRFHTDWLNMIYPRLKIAKDLLTEDGIIFVSINEEEQSNLEKICNEIFGESNHIATMVWKNKYGPGAFTKGVANLHEYILCYGKSFPSNIEAELSEEEIKNYKQQDENYPLRGGYITQPLATKSKDDRPNLVYPLIHNGVEIWPEKQWIWERSRLYEAYNNGEIVINNKDGKYSVRFKQYLKDKNGIIRKGKPLSLLTFCFNQDGTREIQELLGRGVFDFPKPTELIKYFLSLRFNDKDDTDFYVLDFFSGSASTAHAVMKLNAEDGGHRKFILVQLPETCNEKTAAYKAGYKNICEIGKERIRRAGKQILEEQKNNVGDLFAEDITLDIGFRDLKLDSSNMNDVYYTPDDLDKDMLDGLISNIKEDRTAEDLLFQVMLDLGVLLSAKIEEIDIGGKKVFNVDNNYLIACFDEDVDEVIIMEAAKKKPTYFVMRDSSLANDSVSVNFDQIFARYSPDTIRKVL